MSECHVNDKIILKSLSKTVHICKVVGLGDPMKVSYNYKSGLTQVPESLIIIHLLTASINESLVSIATFTR